MFTRAFYVVHTCARRASELLVAVVVLRAGHVVQPILYLLPLEVWHVHQVRDRDAVLLSWPDSEDGVLVGELGQVEPLHRHAEVPLDQLARAALDGLRVLLLAYKLWMTER